MEIDGFTSNKTAVLYARVSDVEQAKKGLSIENQLEQGRKKAKSLGAEVVREYVDDGKSGRTDKRRAFQDAIEYCELLSPDYMIMWSTSRFFRNKLLAAMYKARLEKAGVDWIYTSVDLGKKDDASWLAEGVFELFDEYTSRVNASATKASMIKNARAGHFNGGTVPYGYKSEPDPNDQRRKKLVPNPAEALLVDKIFNMKLLDKMGARPIAYQLNLHGHTYRGKKWTKSTIASLLKNPVVIGQIIFNRKNRATSQWRPKSDWIIVDSHDPIIKLDTWNSVQNALGNQFDDRGFTDRHSPFILSKLLLCGECSSPMTIESAKGRNKRYHYYVCNAARYEKAHDPQRHPADDLDAWIVETICEVIFNERNLSGIIAEVKLRASSWAKDSKLEKAELYREVVDIDKRRQNLFSILELQGQEAPNLMDMSERIQELKSKRIKLEARLSELDNDNAPKVSASAEDVLMMRNFLTNIIQTAPPAVTKKFLQTFIDEISINPGDITITYDSGKLAQASGVVRLKRNWLPVAVNKRTISILVPPQNRPRGRTNIPRSELKRRFNSQ